MIINSAPQNEAVVSNVGSIGEFRIRNSAKAFSILSSGLYANKVRAIIRELSCNAVDSHVAAGKQDTPFDVHLPNALEPHFSIRDYGTGLTHDQVTNIYTTYFESTKTNSNEFIGALGLGSKSPFSYTDNFTVTAIKEGRKGIYTAFINEQGVPSIALMMEEETTEPSGVEVKFSVNDRYDFAKFTSEANLVYKWFKQRPVVSGVSDFTVEEVEYETENIIPGVHIAKKPNRSYAIMGNIAYPIQIPEADQTVDQNLRTMLEYGNFVIEFDIGELDFQASREGLSYIPQTVEAIKNKLVKIQGQLSIYVADEANKIENNWERSLFLLSKAHNYVWRGAVTQYISDSKFEYFNEGAYHRTHQFKLELSVLNECNIQLRSFSKNRHYNQFTNEKHTSSYSGPGVIQYWTVPLNDNVRFVVNDTKIGATERTKFHIKSSKVMTENKMQSIQVFVIEPVDKSKPMLVDNLKTMLANPPESYFWKASELLERERTTGVAKNVTIMCLEERGGSSYRSSSNDMVWRDAGKADTFDNTVTYYYIPLSGFNALNKCNNVKDLSKFLKRSKVHVGEIYGVRKGDIEFIKTQKNWIELDTLIVEQLGKLDNKNLMGVVKQALDINEIIKYNSSDVNAKSPLALLSNTFKDVEAVDNNVTLATQWLCKMYDVKTSSSPQALIDKYTEEVNDIKNRYPLLRGLSFYQTDHKAVAEYINLVDQAKGV